MIEKIQNSDENTASQIHSLFQLSYAVEAKLLNASNFPPLNRSFESYLESDTEFFGYFDIKELAGIIEIEANITLVDINSLVVHPEYFRNGIASKLLEFVFNRYGSILFIVETGTNNFPAIELYKKHGFTEVRQWDTDFGIRKSQFERRIHKTLRD